MTRRPRVSAEQLAHYRAHIRDAWREDGVVCLECGHVWKGLLSHVWHTPGMEGDDYREKWGYNRQAAFVAPGTEARLRELAVAREIGRLGTPNLLAATRTRRPRGPGKRRLQARQDLSESKTKAPDAAVLALARAGLGARDIAARLGVSPLTASRHVRALRQRGLVPPSPRLRPRSASILELARQGFWQSQIARRLGLGTVNVASTLSKLRGRGIEVPTPAGPRPNTARKLDDQTFITLIRQGVTDSEIAARFGLRREP